MGNEIHNPPTDSEIMPRSLIDLLEEIRLTSLNLAVASAKFKVSNAQQEEIKKDLTEVVALSLEAVQNLMKFLEALGIKSEPQPQFLAEINHDKIGESLLKLSEYVEKITENFLKDRGLQ